MYRSVTMRFFFESTLYNCLKYYYLIGLNVWSLWVKSIRVLGKATTGLYLRNARLVCVINENVLCKTNGIRSGKYKKRVQKYRGKISFELKFSSWATTTMHRLPLQRLDVVGTNRFFRWKRTGKIVQVALGEAAAAVADGVLISRKRTWRTYTGIRYLSFKN